MRDFGTSTVVSSLGLFLNMSPDILQLEAFMEEL